MGKYSRESLESIGDVGGGVWSVTGTRGTKPSRTFALGWNSRRGEVLTGSSKFKFDFSWILGLSEMLREAEVVGVPYLHSGCQNRRTEFMKV